MGASTEISLRRGAVRGVLRLCGVDEVAGEYQRLRMENEGQDRCARDGVDVVDAVLHS